MKERFINPFTDFGFKKIFGEESNKDLLMDFLNELLIDKGQITELTFLKNEQLGANETDRKAVFDLYCQNDKGEKFIVELQKAKQRYFKDRSLYYSTFAIQEQAKKGEWDFQLQGVYTIAVMDFVFDDEAASKQKIRHDIQLMDMETKTVFYDKLRFVYLEMPKFNKSLDELETHYDKWLYVLRNLADFEKIPDKLKEKIFLKLFEVAEIAKYDNQEQRAYQDSLKYYRDLKNVINTAVEEAVEIAVKEAVEIAVKEAVEIAVRETEEITLKKKDVEFAKKSLSKGIDVETISEITGLSLEQINALKDESDF